MLKLFTSLFRATVIGVLLASAPCLRAATSTWTGGSAVGANWTDSANWSGGVPSGGGTSVAIVFNGVTRTNVSDDASNGATYGTGSYGNITFNAGAGAFVINQGAASILGLGGHLTNNSPNPQTINVPMQLNSASPATNRVVSVAGSGLLILNNSVGQNSGGNHGLIKVGTGTLTLAASNTYSGGTTVSAGTLNVLAGGGLGTGNVQVASGGTLTLSNAAAIGSNADLLLADTTVTVNLAFDGTNDVNQLSFDGGYNFQPVGIWGAPGSAAQYTSSRFAGAGMLNVQVASALQIQYSGTNMQLTWPASWTALSLYSASNLAGVPVWRWMTNAIVVQSNLNVVTLLKTTNRQYFQLRQVDSTTMNRKLLMGYQGWFGAPGDGSANNSWFHWFHSQNSTVTNINMDFMPDVSELDPDELRPTQMTNQAGTTINVYSAYNQKTVVRHVKWMKDYGLDGVMLQRFVSELGSANLLAFRDKVTANIRLGSEMYGRVFTIMYDISGQSTNNLVSRLTNDWIHLTSGGLHVTDSPRYLKHKGKPVVAIWGFGFSGRSDTPAMAQTTINWFKAAGCTVMGGLPTYWRTQQDNSDTQIDPAWAAVFRSFDIISPWAVGRYGDNNGADNFRLNQIVPDLADATAAGRDYMPVVFPGFSWTNETRQASVSPLNQTPRNAGQFYWRQIYNALLSNCTIIYGAMYDECDEGTAMYKLLTTRSQMPWPGNFVPLNYDGTTLNNDFYLRLAGQAGRMLRGEIPRSQFLPIAPP